MLQNNDVLQQLKQNMTSEVIRMEGIIKTTAKSFGFLEPEDGRDAVFVPPPEMKKVMQGDRVLATIVTGNDGRTSAEITELLEPGLDEFIGRVRKTKTAWFVEPDHPKFNNWIFIPPRQRAGLDEGDWVRAKLADHPYTNNGRASVDVMRKVAKNNEPRVPWLFAIDQHAIDVEPIDQLAEGASSLVGNLVGHEDMTHMPFVTIDAETTRDMDDALHITTLPEGGWLLTVAIADPTLYVKPGMQVDDKARQRAYTFYLPGQTVPMLPRTLSEELCSLKADEHRSALCCQMVVEPSGNISDYRFYEGIIRSHGKLVYDQVSDCLELGSCADWTPDAVIREQIEALHAFSQVRNPWRETNSLVFKSDRPDFSFALEGTQVVGIDRFERRSGNRVVEECMLAANICAADFFKQHGGTAIYNVHAGFDPERIDEVEMLAKQVDASLTAERLLTLEGYCHLRRLLDASDNTYLDRRIVQCHTFSELSLEPKEHFGLGLDAYATWTSPIRKNGDMFNHRRIKAILRGDLEADQPTEADLELLQSGLVRTKRAESDVRNWLYARYLTGAIGQTFEAVITRVTRGGCQVELLENGARAFMPKPFICADRKRIECDDETGQVFVDGECQFRLADTLTVTLTEVEEDKRSLAVTPV